MPGPRPCPRPGCAGPRVRREEIFREKLADKSPSEIAQPLPGLAQAAAVACSSCIPFKRNRCTVLNAVGLSRNSAEINASFFTGFSDTRPGSRYLFCEAVDHAAASEPSKLILV